MAIGVRGSAENSAINGGDITITHPVGVAADDLVLVTAGSSLSAAGGGANLAISTTGYTTLVSRSSVASPPGAAEAPEILVARKKMGATPDSSVTITNAAGTADSTAGVEIVYTGVDTTTPEDATSTHTGLSLGADNPDSPSITTVTADARVVSCVAVAVTDTAVTAPTGYANQIDRNADDTRDVTVGMADIVKAVAGAEDPPAWTNFAVNNDWAAATVALRPAGGASTVTGALVSAGTATATFGAAFNQLGALVSNGVATVTFAGTGLNGGALVSAGAATVAFAGAGVVAGAFKSDGIATVQWAGASRAAGAILSAGVGAASFAGISTAEAVFLSAGQGAAAWAGSALATGALLLDGVATANFAGASSAAAEGALDARGEAAVSWAGASSGGASAPREPGGPPPPKPVMRAYVIH